MPNVYQRSFKVRHYECDAYGHLNHVNYLRYMQETAYDASAAVGYDMVSYQATGKRWYVRETEIEYIEPAYYGDFLTVKSWVEDFHRVRSLRAYEIWKEATNTLIARARSDWVYLENQTGKPVTVPSAMIKAFIPEWKPRMERPRHRIPIFPLPKIQLFRDIRRVEWRDLDPAQHVNNTVYLAYTEECGVRVGMAYGWPVKRLWEEGFAILARSHWIEYRYPAQLGDEIEIITWVVDVKRSTARRNFQIRRSQDGKLLAQAQTLFVWIDLETRKPIRIPRHFLQDFSANIDDGDRRNSV